MTATFNKEGDRGKIVLVYSEDNFKLDDEVTFVQDIGNGVISVRHRNRTVWIVENQAVPLPASQPQRSEESQEQLWDSARMKIIEEIGSVVQAERIEAKLKKLFTLTTIKK